MVCHTIYAYYTDMMKSVSTEKNENKQFTANYILSFYKVTKINMIHHSLHISCMLLKLKCNMLLTGNEIHNKTFIYHLYDKSLMCSMHLRETKLVVYGA